jgi:hypothetical protein
MSTTTLFRCRLLQACRLADRLHLAGAVLELGAHDAADLIRAGRACLADDADMGPLLDATAVNGSRWPRAVHTR